MHAPISLDEIPEENGKGEEKGEEKEEGEANSTEEKGGIGESTFIVSTSHFTHHHTLYPTYLHTYPHLLPPSHITLSPPNIPHTYNTHTLTSSHPHTSLYHTLYPTYLQHTRPHLPPSHITLSPPNIPHIHIPSPPHTLTFSHVCTTTQCTAHTYLILLITFTSSPSLLTLTPLTPSHPHSDASAKENDPGSEQRGETGETTAEQPKDEEMIKKVKADVQ